MCDYPVAEATVGDTVYHVFDTHLDEDKPYIIKTALEGDDIGPRLASLDEADAFFQGMRWVLDDLKNVERKADSNDAILTP